MKGAGPKVNTYLSKLGIDSIESLLLHLPLRYEDRTHIMPIRQVKEGQIALIEGRIIAVEDPARGRTKKICVLEDETGKLSLRFFHILPFQKKILRVGTQLRCYGEVKWGKEGLEMWHPQWQVFYPQKPLPLPTTLTPIYPTTAGLSQYMLRKLMDNALSELKQNPPLFAELIPENLLSNMQLPTLKEALLFLHAPLNSVPMNDLLMQSTKAHERLAMEELLAHQLGLIQMKALAQKSAAWVLQDHQSFTLQFIQNLLFTLTNAQQRVWAEIAADLTKPHPMLRLVQGDVGSGKTVVAALSLLRAVENGVQAVLIAPTELLAEQHYRVLSDWFLPLGIKPVFLTGTVKGKARKEALSVIESGEAKVVIGTHALFQEAVQFAKLGLIIVDEQHRFGVQQRAELREKGAYGDLRPHQLIMTATPIPRTLAMRFYADLDYSTIDELPPGRTPITTSVIEASRRHDIIERIRGQCAAGRQAYWVCTLIEESEEVMGEAAEAVYAELSKLLQPFKVGLVHGRLSASDKEKAMHVFLRNETQVLVATTVIEVGVDVKNATVMVVENAERLGLAQLHQLRGRVGRGDKASHCVLLYQGYLSQIAKERLQVMRETTDGFKIAEKDLMLRGPGEVLGTRQKGELSFRVASLDQHLALLAPVQELAQTLRTVYPDSVDLIINRWLKKEAEYGSV